MRRESALLKETLMEEEEGEVAGNGASEMGRGRNSPSSPVSLYRGTVSSTWSHCQVGKVLAGPGRALSTPCTIPNLD